MAEHPTASKTWWQNIPAGIHYLTEAKEALKQGKSLLLNDRRIPWNGCFAELIERYAKKECTCRLWKEINGSRCNASSPEALCEYLIEDVIGKQCSPVAAKRYRELREADVYIYVHSVPEEDLAVWSSFLNEFFKSGSTTKLIVEADTSLVQKSKQHIVLSMTPSYHDIHSLCLMLLSDRKYDEMMAEYTAALCTELGGMDPEKSAELCDQVSELVKDPLKFPLALEEQKQRQLVCRAQTRGISPFIDIGRTQFIDLAESSIQKVLPIEDEYENRIDDPAAIELRHLWYLYRNCRLPLPPVLNMPLKTLHECRNNIAHLKPLQLDTIQELFSAIQSLMRMTSVT